MADQFVQVGTGATGTTTATDTLTGVTAGSTIVAFGYDGTQSGVGVTVADGQGSYSLLTPPGNVNNAPNNITADVYVLENANAGTHAVQVTGPAGNSVFVVAVEVQAPTSWTTTNTANGASQSSPGSGANILSSGTMTIASASTIVSLINDCSSVTGSDTPTAGTSPIAFTSRQTGNNVVMGVWRVQTAAAATNAAATGGSVTTTDEFISLAIAVLNASSGSIIRQMMAHEGG